MKICGHIFCPSDLRIATKLTDSRESEFPPTNQNVQLFVKSTIKVIHSQIINILGPEVKKVYFPDL